MIGTFGAKKNPRYHSRLKRRGRRGGPIELRSKKENVKGNVFRFPMAAVPRTPIFRRGDLRRLFRVAEAKNHVLVAFSFTSSGTCIARGPTRNWNCKAEEWFFFLSLCPMKRVFIIPPRSPLRFRRLRRDVPLFGERSGE